MGVADSGLEILYLPSPDAVNDSAHALVLCAHFAPDAQDRTTQDGAARFLTVRQTIVHIIKVAIEPFEGRNSWRKKGVLFRAGPLADRVHRSGAVAVFPHQIQRRIGQALFHVTYSWHETTFPCID